MSKGFFTHLGGYIVLAVVLTAGAAQGLSGTNTVDSGDIKDGEVKFADIAAGAVTQSRLAANAVSASRIQDGSVFQNEMADKFLHFGTVSAGGTLADAKALANVSHTDNSGIYDIDLTEFASGKNVGDCTFSATLKGSSAGDINAQQKVTGIFPNFTFDPNTVRVRVFDDANAAADRAFSLIAFCPTGAS